MSLKKKSQDSSPSAQAPVPQESQDTPKKPLELPKQVHNFIPVYETSRTYLYPNNQSIKIEHVYAMSPRPDGGHRLLIRTDHKKAWSIAPGLIAIHHENLSENATGYVFLE